MATRHSLGPLICSLACGSPCFVFSAESKDPKTCRIYSFYFQLRIHSWPVWFWSITSSPMQPSRYQLSWLLFLWWFRSTCFWKSQMSCLMWTMNGQSSPKLTQKWHTGALLKWSLSFLKSFRLHCSFFSDIVRRRRLYWLIEALFILKT